MLSTRNGRYLECHNTQDGQGNLWKDDIQTDLHNARHLAKWVCRGRTYQAEKMVEQKPSSKNVPGIFKEE